MAIQQDLTLHDYWRILRRHKWAFSFCVVGCLGGTAAFTYRQAPMYRGTAEIMIKVSGGGMPSMPSGIADLLGSRSTGGEDPVEDALNIMRGPIIMDRVVKRLNLSSRPKALEELNSKIKIGRKVEYGNIIRVTVESPKAGEIAEIANVVSEEYLSWATDQASRNQISIAESLKQKFSEAESKLMNSENKIKEFQESGYTPGMAAALTSQKYQLENELEMLQRRYTAQHQRVVDNKRQLHVLEERLQTASQQEVKWNRMQREMVMIAESWRTLKIESERADAMSTQRVIPGTLINPAVTPVVPFKPNRRLNMSVGGILGLLLGIVATFLMENLDTSLGSVEEVEASIQLPVLGVIPYALSAGTGSPGRRLLHFFRPPKNPSSRILAEKLILNQGPRSRTAEAFRSLRANLSLILGKENKKLIVFTSSGPREGKTLTVCNYALAAAESGLRTLLVDADLRRPSLYKLFGLPRQPGLVELTRNQLPWRSVLRGTTDFLLAHTGVEKVLGMPGIENLRIITSGGFIENPLEIVGGPLIREIFEEARGEYDLILVDCPPLLMFADPLILAQHSDGVIIVYEMGRTARDALSRVKIQLQNAQTPVLGVVINGMRLGEEYYYSRSSAYNYYYAEEGKRSKKPS